MESDTTGSAADGRRGAAGSRRSIARVVVLMAVTFAVDPLASPHRAFAGVACEWLPTRSACAVVPGEGLADRCQTPADVYCALSFRPSEVGDVPAGTLVDAYVYELEDALDPVGPVWVEMPPLDDEATIRSAVAQRMKVKATQLRLLSRWLVLVKSDGGFAGPIALRETKACFTYATGELGVHTLRVAPCGEMSREPVQGEQYSLAAPDIGALLPLSGRDRGRVFVAAWRTVPASP